jgi:hypothetical protein
MLTYNDNINSCSSDLSTFGDLTGMRKCFQELGLNVPLEDGYFSQDSDEAIDVIEIF